MATKNLEKACRPFKKIIVHIAIEKADNHLTKAIIFSGFNVNKKEGCGLTPVHLAVMSSNTIMVQFLINRNARFNEPMFSSVPSPKSMAEKLNLAGVMNIITEKDHESDE